MGLTCGPDRVAQYSKNLQVTQRPADAGFLHNTFDLSITSFKNKIMKKLLHQLLLPAFLLIVQLSAAQNIGIGTGTPHSSAKLEVQSQNSGVLLPRMSSAQRKAIPSPAKGLLVFDTDRNAFMFWNGSEWQILVPSNASNGNPEEIFNPGNSSVNNFGYKVAISGNFAAVSAAGDAGRRVYIYEKIETGWVQRHAIVCPDTGGAFFGGSLDMDGEYLVIGDYLWKNTAGTSVGKVFVYKRNNSTYIYETGLQSTTTIQDRFGYDVAISQSTPNGVMIAVGVPRAGAVSPARNNAGRVMLYKKQNNNWVLAQSVQPAEVLSGDETGFSVDLDGSVLAFGAPLRENNAGRIYIYEYQPASSLWQLSVINSSSFSDRLLGYSVSVSGTWVAAGQPVYTSGINGSVTLFKKNTQGTWGNRSLTEPNGLSVDGRTIFFGKNVKLDGDYLLVGAASSMFGLGTNFRYGNESGKAILYKLRYIGADIIQASVKNITQAEFSYYNDYFAESVGLSQGNIIIGHQHSAVEGNSIRGSVLFNTYEE